MPGRATNEPSNYIAVGRQSAFDTEATTFHFLKHLDGSGFELDQSVESEREGGDGQEIGLRYKSGIRANGALNANSRPEHVSRAVAWTLGNDTRASVALGATSKQVHTIIPAATIPYLTLEQKWADVIERSTNNQMTQLVLEGEAGRPWKVSNNFVMGGTYYLRNAVASSLTPARESNPCHYYAFGSYTFDGAGTYNKKVTKWRVEVNRNVDEDIQTTGLNPEDVVPLNFDVAADATIKYEDKNFFEKIIAGAVGATQVPVDLATGSLDLYQVMAGGSLSARVVLPFLNWTEAKVNRLDPDGKTVYLDVVGMGLKNATHQIFAVIDDQTPTAHTA